MSDEIEKEIVYKFDYRISKDGYIKPVYGKISRKHIVPRRIMLVLIICEIIALIILDKSSARILWIILLIYIFIFRILGRVLLYINEIKQYKKIHAAKEDWYSYTFYNDCAITKSPIAEVTLNYDTAEFITEDDEQMMIIFPFNNVIYIEKGQYDEEQLAFFRNIVPEEKQKKAKKATSKKFFAVTSLMVLYTALLAVMVAVTVSTNAHAYYSEYPETTYISFEACLNAGTVKDIVIVNKKYIEYTFIGRGEDERYYTEYSGDDIDRLTEILDSLDVRWKYE